MEIERGIQNNCSELVVRLHTTNIDFVKEELKSIGIGEVLVKDYWNFEDKQEDWDDETNDEIISIEDIPIEAIEILERLDNRAEEIPKDEREELERKLKDEYNIDYNDDRIMLRDIDNPLLPDFENKASINIGKDVEYNDWSDEIAIWAHQHCQAQLFPTLKKIAEHFDAEVEGYDGGSAEDFIDWCVDGSTIYDDEEEDNDE